VMLFTPEFSPVLHPSIMDITRAAHVEFPRDCVFDPVDAGHLIARYFFHVGDLSAVSAPFNAADNKVASSSFNGTERSTI